MKADLFESAVYEPFRVGEKDSVEMGKEGYGQRCLILILLV